MSDAIYVGHDSKIKMEFRTSSSALDLIALGLTRVLFTMADKTVDSDAYPSAFDWATDGANGVVEFDLTGFAFDAGSYGARVVIYYPAAVNGVVVADGYPVNVGAKIEGVEPAAADLVSLEAIFLNDSPGYGSDKIAYVGTGKTVTQGIDHAGALIYLETAQSIPTAAWTAITNLDTEDYDDDGFHDLVTNPGRITIPVGVVRAKLGGQIGFSGSVGASGGATIRKNGTEYLGTSWTGGGGPLDTFQVNTPVLNVVAGDYFELLAYQESGGNLNASISKRTFFSIEVKQWG